MNRTRIIALLFVCYALVATLRLTAPCDLDSHDQAKQGLYIVDIVENGKFFLPTLHGVEPATKPPLYNWAAAALSLVGGGVTELTIRLPAVFCGLGVVFVTFLLAEALFSKEVGLFAGLVLILSHHFASLSSTARTDMMLCLFISLSLLFFLYAYRKPDRKSIFCILMFVCMGLGTITKGPVALALPSLIIVVFLFSEKNLKWLKSARLAWGLAIWLLITLGWFIPALIEGGREFFDIVVYDEMVNRFLGIGTRAQKTRPFYYPTGHFFGKFLPWSLFVPSAVWRYWKSEDEDEKKRLLLPIVWFFAVLIFFSVSRGKRSDYILPLYPAASVIVAQFWLSVGETAGAAFWKKHLTTLSAAFLVSNFFLVAGLLAILAVPDLGALIASIAPESAENTKLLQDTLALRTHFFLLTALPLGALSVAGAILALKGNTRALFIAMLVVAGLNLALYFEVLSPRATKLSGEKKKAFCKKVSERIDSPENLKFGRAKNSMLFYLGKNERLLSREEILKFFHNAGTPYLITTKKDYVRLQERADLEFDILENSGYLVREKAEYLLLGRKEYKASP